MQATCEIFNFLVATFKKIQRWWSEYSLFNPIYLKYHFTCNQYKHYETIHIFHVLEIQCFMLIEHPNLYSSRFKCTIATCGHGCLLDSADLITMFCKWWQCLMALLASSFRSGVPTTQLEVPVSVWVWTGAAAPGLLSTKCGGRGSRLLANVFYWREHAFPFLAFWELCFALNCDWVLDFVTGLPWVQCGILCLSSLTLSDVFTTCLTWKPWLPCWEVKWFSFFKESMGLSVNMPLRLSHHVWNWAITGSWPPGVLPCYFLWVDPMGMLRFQSADSLEKCRQRLLTAVSMFLRLLFIKISLFLISFQCFGQWGNLWKSSDLPPPPNFQAWMISQ